VLAALVGVRPIERETLKRGSGHRPRPGVRIREPEERHQEREGQSGRNKSPHNHRLCCQFRKPT
jgi:hypothetical protein